ncbi:C40 family peptidase [Cellulomonas fengjieae]|uniref:C40 family peptidase n=1 Tax=Cellulomonas fengjieae TaxID=2819978 RepID=UPI001AAE4384|nr:C40 family peptidase [Cellulomonas fengjieae]MBO3100682.1 C40 family peptidase [Cellulomonas fengjieae]
MSAGIAAVQARIGELRALVEGPSATVSTGSASTGSASVSTVASASFGSALAAASVPATTAAPASATGQGLVAAATKYLGVPYVWGGESLDEGGLDCSGLVQRSLADIGVTPVPRTAREQMTLGTAVPSLDQALPGDLVVFGGGNHIGIYVGEGRMIDAPKPGKAVTVREVYTEPTAIRRILPQAGAVPVAMSVAADPAVPVATDAASAVALAQRAALQALVGLGASGSGVAA